MATIISAAVLILSLSTTWSMAQRSLRYRSVQGVALSGTALSLYGSLTWSAYAFGTGNHVQLIAALAGAAGSIAILWVASTTTGLPVGRVLVGLLAYAIAVSIIDATQGLTAVGVTASCLTCITKIPQIRAAWRTPGGDGVSVASQGFDASQLFLWICVGILRADMAIIASSTFALFSAVFIAVRTQSARRIVSVADTPAATQPALAIAA